MKRVRMLPFSLAALAVLVAPAALRAQAIPVKPGGELSSLVGLPFDVPIVADMTARTERLGSFALRLTWDPAVLRIDGGVNASFGAITVNGDSAALGIIRMAGVNPAGAAGVVTLGIARFTPIAGGTTLLALTLSELYASGSFADLLPSAVVSGGAYCPARGRFGDVDNDGSANSRDALVALSNAVGLDVSAFDIFLGDVDGSGVTNARDALIILSSAVGLDVSGFRVLRLAGGSCALNPALTMSITPSPLDLVLGQSAQLEARAANGAGGLQSLPDVVWKSSRPGVVAVAGDGRAIARDTGTAVITALRGVSDSAQATVTVVAGRTLHVVDAAAVSATNRLGSAALPFATIGDALRFAQEGDTVEIRPGRYEAPVVVGSDIVLLGDTLLDGTRPLIFGTGDPYSAGPGVLMAGTGSRQVFNLAFESLYDAVEVNGPDVVLLRGLRSVNVENGIVANSPMTSLHLEQSQLIGRGVSIFDSDGIQVNDTMDTLVIEDTEMGDFGGDGVYGYYAQSVTIRRSNLHDFGRYGLELGGFGSPVNLVMDSSRLQRSYYGLMYIQDLQSAVFTGNILVNENGDILDQYQENIPPGGFISFKGDSIQCEDYCYWLYLNDLDSLTIDSLRAALPNAYGQSYNISYVRVTRSTFRDVSGDVLDVSNYNAGGVVEVKNSTFVGDPRCDGCADAIEVYNAAVVVDSSTFVNLDYGIYAYGDSSMTVTNSLFRRVYYPIQWYGNYYVGCPYSYCSTLGALTVRNNTMNGYYYGIEAFDGEIVVDSNTFIGGSYGAIEVGGPAAITVTRNVIAAPEYDGIDVYPYDSLATTLIADNVLTDVESYGIYVYGDDYPDSIHTRVEILRNTVSCKRTGSQYADAIDVYSSDAILMDNQVLNCWSGIDVRANAASARVDSVIGNTVVVPAGGWGGIVARDHLRSRISRNTVTGDTVGYLSYGMIWAQGDYYTGGVALIDLNTVSRGTDYGIYAADLDTAVVAQNTVTDVANGYYGAVAFTGYIKYSAAIAGNTIRRAKGAGISTNNSDTATVKVDSNLVSASGAIGIHVQGGAAQLTRNTVVNSGTDGVHVYFYAAVPLPITLNNISGSLQFGLREEGQGVSAPSNWWGDALGPRCGATECNSRSLGDSVTSGVSFTNWLTAPNASSPPSTPPRAMASRAARPFVASRALPAPEQMPAARTAEHERAPRVRAAATASASRIPASLPPARVQALQARVQQLAARVAARQQVESRREAERASREATWRTRIEQLRAQVASDRATKAVPTAHPAPGRRP